VLPALTGKYFRSGAEKLALLDRKIFPPNNIQINNTHLKILRLPSHFEKFSTPHTTAKAGN
jgi:hypothetical protein